MVILHKLSSLLIKGISGSLTRLFCYFLAFKAFCTILLDIFTPCGYDLRSTCCLNFSKPTFCSRITAITVKYLFLVAEYIEQAMELGKCCHTL